MQKQNFSEAFLRSGAKTNITCAKIDLDFTHTFLPTVYVLVFVIGLLANCCGLKSVLTSWKKLGNINIFILNLGVADLLYVFTLPFLVVYYAANSRWIFGRTFCKVTRFCFNLNLYCSIGFLTCISIYRYLGIVHPMKVMGRITRRHSVAISILVWLLVIIQILPDMFFDKTPRNSSDACFDTTANDLIDLYLPYSIGWTFTGFGVPLIIIVGCYGHVAVVLASKANVNALLKQRCLKLVVMLIVLFSVCFIPYHVLRNLNLKTRILKRDGTCHASFDDIYLAYQVSRGLACMNSAINPLIYLVGNDDFLVRFHEISKRARMSVAQVTGVRKYRKPPDTDSSGMNSRAGDLNEEGFMF
ncbi:P2Y purinoceptor 1-like [Megalops cyprinoides]|uniref:P2Y purinoceptor 1-like n=1 Tax=Megalops cyprinoides TaxID=118141 RepID=UPI00186439D7|nr:P2Y purinoceptor 1-like [Megalops cyprinoides]